MAKETRADREAREAREERVRVREEKAAKAERLARREARLEREAKAERATRQARVKKVDISAGSKSPKIVTKETLPKKLKRDVVLASKGRISLNGEVDSILGNSAETIHQLLEENKNESASMLISKRMLQALVDLVPHAEANVRDTGGKHGVYQINSLITSIREVMSDMQATRDRSALGQSLIEKVVRPMFLDIGMELVKEEARLMGEVKALVPFETYKIIKERHSDATSRLAHVMKQKYETATTETIKFLQA